MKLEFMELAISEALKSDNDIPVGAVIAKDGVVIAKAFNQKEKNNDSTQHAEILAIKKASGYLGNWRLAGCTMYVTLEPCPMCASAIIQSRIEKIYFGSYDILYGALGSKIDLRKIHNSKLEVKGGIMEEKCDNMIDLYFKDLR
ncbi:MAG: nucleoside deaminase [Candidatus Gastranaerophilales bacterium]|nr:nucleoside deaminase [Candidatus Gastranaerophilales bacterium]